MATLYELTAEYQMLLDMAMDPDTDPQTLADTMEAIGGEIEDKAEGYAMVMRSLEADAAAIRAEEKRLAGRRQSIEANINRMKMALENAMRATGKTKFKTRLFSFGIQKNPPALKIDDPKRVSHDFLIPQEPKIDTDAIKKYIKDGFHFDWCHIEQSEGLRIR